MGPSELLACRGNLAKILIFMGLQLLLLPNEDNCTHTAGPLKRGNKVRDVKALDNVMGSLSVKDDYHTFFLAMFSIKDVVLACRNGNKGHSFIQDINVVVYYILLIIVSEELNKVTKTDTEPFLTGLESGWRHNLFCEEAGNNERS